MTYALSLWRGVIRTGIVPRVPIAPQILAETAADHEMTVKEMIAKESRGRRYAFARYDAMSRLRAVLDDHGEHRFNLTAIGRLIGGRDHTTVIYGLERWSQVGGHVVTPEARLALSLDPPPPVFKHPGCEALRASQAAKREAEAA